MKDAIGSMKCMWSARWRHAAFVAGDVIIIQIALSVAALIRAGDYSSGVHDDFAALERVYPLGVWAFGGWLVASCIMLGIVWRRHALVWLGHAIGAGYYLLIAVTQVQRVLDPWPPDGDVTQFLPWPAELTALTVLAVLLVVGMWRSRHAGQCAAHWAGGIGVGTTLILVLLAHAPLDGARGIMPLVILSTLHLLVMLRTGPRPLTPERAHPVEVTAGDDGAGDQ